MLRLFVVFPVSVVPSSLQYMYCTCTALYCTVQLTGTVQVQVQVLQGAVVGCGILGHATVLTTACGK